MTSDDLVTHYLSESEMEKHLAEQGVDQRVIEVGQALRAMPTPSITITLRMMVHLNKPEIKNRRKMSQSWEDICGVFINLGYVNAKPATIIRYYYGDAPKKLPAVRAMILEMERNTKGSLERTHQKQLENIEQISSSNNQSKPTVRGPVI